MRDCYIVLDLPSPIAEEIIGIRRSQRDEFRAALPAEITLTGSSGVGVLDPDQNPEEVFSLIDQIASETAPIETSFGPVMRFPNTDIFVLMLSDEEPFRTLHMRLANSGIRFQPTPFDYTPHCTLRSRSPVTTQQAAELLALRVPGRFTLATVSVHMMDKLPMSLLYRTTLRGDILR